MSVATAFTGPQQRNKFDRKMRLMLTGDHGLAPLGAPIPMHKFLCLVME